MIIIADSGSSKTDWRLITKDKVIEEVQTSGLNPLILSEADFTETIQNSKLKEWPTNSISKVYFYGAGITDTYLQDDVAKLLQNTLNISDVVAQSDLVGAGRAIYGTEEGMVGILGTGSNNGYFNGEDIEMGIPPLGYMLGDEGSGNALGKRLAVAFLRGELPGNLTNEFKSFYPGYKDLLSNIYRSSQPAGLLASFVPFIHQHKEDSFLTQLIEDEFTKYFRLIGKAENTSQIGFVGSVAYYFKGILHQVAHKERIKLYKILKTPIEALTLYHQGEIS